MSRSITGTVHIAVAFIAIAAVTFIGSVPVMMFAQESIGIVTQESSFAPSPARVPSPPQVILEPPQSLDDSQKMDLTACLQQCSKVRQNCLAEFAPTDAAALSQCEKSALNCESIAQQAGTCPQTDETDLMPPAEFEGYSGFQSGMINPEPTMPSAEL